MARIFCVALGLGLLATGCSTSRCLPAPPPSELEPTPAPAASAPPKAAAGRHVYEGTIAGKPVLVRLRCTESACAGSYFYRSSGELLTLRSESTEHLVELEGVADRVKVTGQLAFTQPIGTARLEGSWSASPGAASQPIVLTTIAKGAPRALMRRFAEHVETNRACHVRVRSIELVGLHDEALEDRINALLAPEHLASQHAQPSDLEPTDTCGEAGKQCSPSRRGYRILCRDMDARDGLFLHDDVSVAFLDSALLSIRSEYDFDGGGAHPSDGVRGLTVDLRTGSVLDARALLRENADAPDWNALVVRKGRDELGASDAQLEVGMLESTVLEGPEGSVRWSDFYLTASGLELIPVVGEAARIVRHSVQHVPFARMRAYLAPNGPAAHLYARR